MIALIFNSIYVFFRLDKITSSKKKLQPIRVKASNRHITKI